jgi:hypothetical protein
VLAKLFARLTYANVVATLALFVALGGSSYAAIKITGKNVENSSLTGADVKNNSLTGRDVKSIRSGDVSDHSLLAKDFRAEQLPSGPQGAKGDKGAQGAPGPSDTWAANFSTGGAQISSLPDGSYVGYATVTWTNTDTVPHDETCQTLSTGGATGQGQVTNATSEFPTETVPGNSAHGSAVMAFTFTVRGAGGTARVLVGCPDATSGLLTVTRVGALHT